MEDDGFAMEKIAQHGYSIYRSAISMATLEYLDGQKLVISCSLEPQKGLGKSAEKSPSDVPYVPPFRCFKCGGGEQLLVDDYPLVN